MSGLGTQRFRLSRLPTHTCMFIHLAKLAAPEVAVEARNEHHFCVPVRGVRAKVQQVRKELRLVHRYHLMYTTKFY